MGINLSYNSQNWREDPGGIWQLGADTGYGYGWKLQAGSLTPVYQDYWNIHHWLFIDSTGAEYKLNQFNSGVWTSVEGIYLTFDPNITGSPGSTHLYFPDGSFWELNALSAGTEPDAGTYYPSLMQDTNGNQIKFKYKQGLGISWPDSSARIDTIEDVRGNGSPDYTFLYNTDTPPHLTSISNSIGTSENYAFTYTTPAALLDPFLQFPNFGNAVFLQTATVNNPAPGPNLTTSFAFSNSGELTQMTTPYGGYLSWGYGTGIYNGSRSLREVQHRSLMLCAASVWAYCSWDAQAPLLYTLTRDANSALSFHSTAAVLDADGHGEKDWYFDTTATNASFGLAYRHEDRLQQGQGTNPIGARRDDLTWMTEPTSGNPYIQSDVTTEDYGNTAQIQKKTTQTIDQYGNLLQTAVYDYGNPPTLARTYNYSYVTDPTFAGHANYISKHITNRLMSSFVNGGTQTATFVQNNYDNSGFQYATSVTGGTMHEHDDANYDTGYVYRGNITLTTTLTGLKTATYDIGGNTTGTAVNGVSTGITMDPTRNFAVPSQIKTNNSLPFNATWNSFFGLSTTTDANNDQASFGYTNARPSTTTSPYGAQTTYSYNDSPAGPNPPYRMATTNGHYVETGMDGFGRTVLNLTNNNGAGVSAVSTFYGPCGCSPLGKVRQVSQPFASGSQNIYWTKYTYDGLGRTKTVAVQETATVYSTTTYDYHGNSVTVTDPAGKWKQFYMDAFGNLTIVVEPNPAATGSAPPSVPMTVAQLQSAVNGNSVNLYFVTTYGYDVLNHLTLVTMQRPGVAQPQTRMFNYANSNGVVGPYLLSATNPENGTVNYTYVNGMLKTKTDAKNQLFTYGYDNYNRLTSVTLTLNNIQTTLRTYSYDTDPPGFSPFSNYALGRLTAIQYPTATIPIVERYTYTPYFSAGAGLPAGKRLQISPTLGWTDQNGQHYSTVTTNLDASFSYNNEGKITFMTYPTSVNGGTPTYTYSYDGGGRLSGMSDGSSSTLVNPVTYGPSNELTNISYRTNAGAGFTTETRGYNNLVQLTSLTTSGLSAAYNYQTGSNNGKISSSVINGETVMYYYDSLNRLIQATSSAGWGESYGIDGFGNLTTKTPTAGSAPSLSVVVDQHNCIQTGATCDLNGNQVYGGVVYDAENHIVSPPGANNTVSYFYDAQNKRIWSWDGTRDSSGFGNASGYHLSLYSPGGQKLGTYEIDVINNGFNGPNLTLQTTQLSSDLYFGGRRLAVQDRLGSVGSYYPYGEARGAIPQDTWSFATYWRDYIPNATTNLDYADQRYYSNQYGRFMTPDPYQASAKLVNPTSWNRYTYVNGDPVNSNDPSGLDGDYCSGGDLWSDVNGGWDCVFDTDQEENTSYSGVGGVWLPTPEGPSGYDSNGNPVFTDTTTCPPNCGTSGVTDDWSPPQTAFTASLGWFGFWGFGGGLLNGAYIPASSTVCLGISIGAGTPGKSFSAGPLTSTGGVPIQSIIQGFSFAFAAQLEWYWGGQITYSPGNGWASGPTVGTPGVSLTGGGSACLPVTQGGRTTSAEGSIAPIASPHRLRDRSDQPNP